MENIFETLIRKNICFAVVVGTNTFKTKGIDLHTKDYFLILLQSRITSPRIDFLKNKQYPKIFTYTLYQDEIDYFKENSDKFNRVISNEFGRVFELKGNNFKKKYEQIKNKSNSQSNNK